MQDLKGLIKISLGNPLGGKRFFMSRENTTHIKTVKNFISV